MTESRWWTYVVSVAGDVQNKEIADRAGFDKSNVTRWSQGSRPAVEFVLKFARAYGQPVIAALVAAEYITDREANIREVKIGVEDLSELDLARELYARVERRAAPNVVHGRFSGGRAAEAVAPDQLAAAHEEVTDQTDSQGFD